MTSRLRQIARSVAVPAAEEPERCDLCSEPIPPEHRHLLDLESRDLKCVCRACKVLFDRGAAGGGHYRLVPERRLALDGFAMDDVRWDELRIPVDMAFFFRHSGEARTVAYYPSPAGPTESLLELDAWDELERDNPVLDTLEPDVEALLVDRAKGARRQFIVPIEDPYRLVALIRTQWRGLTGGREVWQAIDEFFDDLESRAEKTNDAREEAAWQTT